MNALLFAGSFMRVFSLKSLFVVTALVMFLVMRNPAYAHTVEETTAQIILRDGQVEIRLQTDRAHWVEAVSDSSAFLLGEIDDVIPHGLTIKEQDAFFKSVLQEQTLVRVNNNQQAIAGITVIENEQSQKMTIVMYATHKSANVESIGVSFPKSLGNIHSSFTKPQYRMIPAGSYSSVKLK
ncbi:hypothetical protein Q4561_18580 [Alteromonas sp. 1_MG-2023]|uniref:hypothetical protein n=1 Tax=Alteromonas sp. 1_MG-2023 TaxID=3062669 RepID=UPI0026E2D4A2|nr:hypothetical protein [Alteromonas sp. 1_MG-2023]MDO6569085.1 hypothetical protein [Alteromonas sp. 1_MG-2023]